MDYTTKAETTERIRMVLEVLGFPFPWNVVEDQSRASGMKRTLALELQGFDATVRLSYPYNRQACIQLGDWDPEVSKRLGYAVNVKQGIQFTSPETCQDAAGGLYDSLIKGRNESM